MAQVLKENLKESIIAASTEEFLEKGYENASLRNIAKKANMTVGNLYRYFKNKEDINKYIVGPTLSMIESSIQKYTHTDITFETRVFNIKINFSDLHITLDSLADELAEIYESNSKPFNILMMHSELNKEITSWFSDLISYIIKNNYPISGFDNEIEILSNTFAESIFAGMRYLFLYNDSSLTDLKSMIKVYFRSYLYMLDTDIRKFMVF